MNENDDIVREFVIESTENLDSLDQDLLALESGTGAAETVQRVFRTIHTVKGTCGFLGFGRLEALSHAGETLLVRMREGAIEPTRPVVDGLLEMVDAIRRIIATIDRTGGEGDDDFTALAAELTALAAPALGGAAPPPPGTAGIDPPAETRAEAAPTVDAWEPLGRDPEANARPGAADTTIRVDVVLLDRLMNLVGELVLARNQVLQFAAASRDAGFVGASQRLNLITTELQESVMKTRMQPIGTIWNKLPRAVRDLAALCNKKAVLEMEGSETDLDKTILEAIKDPLTHMLRNALDHGLEGAADRQKAGKPETGTIRLRAYHEGGQVNIEMTDDGAGINVERVKKRAVERGLILAEAAARLSEREAIALIFEPGFSTAEQVSSVSGRGVGMDVVRSNIERIGGSVDVRSTFGRGTTIRIKIPLTLAIIPALIVTSGGQRFAIPQVSLVELVRVERDGAGHETIGGVPIHRLRGNILPLVFLDRELGMGTPEVDDGGLNIVVLQADGRLFGLVVDSVLDTEEIVVKPLGRQLKGHRSFAGATIMGDGRVALILDVLGVAQESGVVGETREKGRGAEAQSVGVASAASATSTMLVVETGGGSRFAVPLASVSRLEEFDGRAVEHSLGRRVVQYRGGIMPLVDLGGALGAAGSEPRPDGLITAIVHDGDAGRIAFVVDDIIDIVATGADAKSTRTDGVAGSAVLQEKITDIVDLDRVAAAQRG